MWPALRIVLGALMLMTVTFAIGRPTVFSDTDDYYAQGRGVVRALETWAIKGRPPFDLSEAHYRFTDPDGANAEPTHNQDGARSVYYGLLTYLAQAAGSLWWLAAGQAGLAAGLVYVLWRRVSTEARGYLGVMAGLSVASTLPVFTGFAMPDVFAGFAAIATVLAVLYGDSFGRWGRAGLWLLLAAGINFHGSNLLTCLGLAAVALAGLAVMRRSWRVLAARGGFVLTAAVAAMLAAQAYALAVRLRTGDELGRPPFLTARVLADGPGRTYLAHACGRAPRFQVCAFRKLPLDDTEDILWADEPELGIFNSSEYPVRLKLVHQDTAFALAAIAYRPGRELAAALRNWGAQLAAVDLHEPLRDPGFYLVDSYWRTTTLPRLIQGTGRCSPERGTCALRAPERGLSLWTTCWAAVALLGGAVLAGLTLRHARARSNAATLRTFAAAGLLMLAIPLNAAVCGMLSGPFARYEMRMLWLIPLAALMLLAAWRQARACAQP